MTAERKDKWGGLGGNILDALTALDHRLEIQRRIGHIMLSNVEERVKKRALSELNPILRDIRRIEEKLRRRLTPLALKREFDSYKQMQEVLALVELQVVPQREEGETDV